MSLRVVPTFHPSDFPLLPIETWGQIFLDAADSPEFHQLATERFLALVLFFLDQNPSVKAEQMNKLAAEARDVTQQFFNTLPAYETNHAPTAGPAAPAAAPVNRHLPTRTDHYAQFHSQSFQQTNSCYFYPRENNRTVVKKICDSSQKNAFYIEIASQIAPSLDELDKAFAIRIDRLQAQPYTLIHVEKGAPRLFQTDSFDAVIGMIDSWSPPNRHLTVHYLKDLSHGTIYR